MAEVLLWKNVFTIGSFIHTWWTVFPLPVPCVYCPAFTTLIALETSMVDRTTSTTSSLTSGVPPSSSVTATSPPTVAMPTTVVPSPTSAVPFQCEDFEFMQGNGTCESCSVVGCNPVGTESCTQARCICLANIAGDACDECASNFFGPVNDCQACMCDKSGTIAEEVCNSTTGQCPCVSLSSGQRCDGCVDGYYVPLNATYYNQQCGGRCEYNESSHCQGTLYAIERMWFLSHIYQTCTVSFSLYKVRANGTPVWLDGRIAYQSESDSVSSASDVIHMSVCDRPRLGCVLQTEPVYSIWRQRFLGRYVSCMHMHLTTCEGLHLGSSQLH